jgi:tetrahydromethanopterin S-methyltransferase subunit B
MKSNNVKNITKSDLIKALNKQKKEMVSATADLVNDSIIPSLDRIEEKIDKLGVISNNHERRLSPLYSRLCGE